MRLLEVKTPQEAVKKAVGLISKISSYSELHSFKDPSEAWKYFEDRIEELADHNIGLRNP